MSELLFFMSLTDTELFATFLIEKYDTRFAVDNGESHQIQICKSWSDIAKIIDRNIYRIRLYVQSPEWDLYPLSISEVHAKDGRHYFAIDQRIGGPAFDFMISGPTMKGAPDLIPGWFSDFPWYIVDKSWRKDHSKYRTFDRPSGMKAAFKAVQAYMRRNAVRSICVESGHVGPWILPGALTQWKSGIWLRQGSWHFRPRNNT